MSEKKPLFVIAGPTASGKTALSIAIAKWLDTEVVSADSMQVYKDINIATACPSLQERDGVVHHLLDFLPLTDAYSVARYADDARRIIEKVHANGKTPVLCGGTGLYIAAVTDHVCYEQQDDEQARAVRRRLQNEHQLLGDEGMWHKLMQVDPLLAEKLHVHDRTRVIRALEVYELTGIPMSEQQRRQKEQPSPYETTMLVLDFHDRAVLYERIDRRVDIMVANGLLEETARVVRKECPTAMQAIGCKELKPYFDAECSLSAALENMKRRSRQYAKRQMSWFRRIDSAHRLYVDDYSSPTELVEAAKKLFSK